MSDTTLPEEVVPHREVGELNYAIGELRNALNALNDWRKADKKEVQGQLDGLSKKLDGTISQIRGESALISSSVQGNIEEISRHLNVLALRVEFVVERVAELRQRLNEFQMSESAAREARNQQLEASFGRDITALEQRLANASQQRHAALENRIAEAKSSLENRSAESKYGLEKVLTEMKASVDIQLTKTESSLETRSAELKAGIEGQIKGQVIQGIVWGIGLCAAVGGLIFGVLKYLNP